jgi:hypothetical protein
MGTLDKTDANFFYPTIWQQMDSTDADFGSNSPVYIEVPGATPSTYFVAPAKDGHIYFLDSKKLGGMGGQVIDLKVASVAMAIRTAPTAYTTSKGVHVALTIDRMPGCAMGGAQQVVLAVRVPPGAPPKPEVAWCTPINGQAAPISTSTDGKTDVVVWFMSGGKLKGVDGDTGDVVFAGGDGTCGGVRQWTSPIAVKGRIVVGGDGHLCSWSSP